MARKTKEDAEATRNSLLDAAELVFLARGVDNASLEEIARSAGLTRGALYWHFANKEELFDAMLSRVRLPMLGLVNQLIEADNSDIPALMRICTLALTQLADNPQHQRVYTILLHRTSNDFGHWRQGAIAEHSIQQMACFFNTHGAKHLHPTITPHTAALTLHTQLLGVFSDWLRDPNAWCLKQYAPILISNLFRGLTGRDWE